MNPQHCFFLFSGSGEIRGRQKKQEEETSKEECQIKESETSEPVRGGDDSSVTAELNQRRRVETLTESQTGGKKDRSITGFGSRGVCLLSGCLWLGGG